ncbi:MAG: DUF5691 domain-containing protein [Neomegalonema sp.]|nr:DUF5691 domain-containing protein [Neomegalonema sp.]
MMNDANAFAAALAAARMGWMTGQPSKVDLPGVSDLDEKEAQLRLLALDAQFRALTGAPVSPSAPFIASSLPEPSRPLPPEAARTWFQRAWRDAQQNEKGKLLRLLDRRGYMAHPLDFMPQTYWDGLPDAYAPWLEWARGARRRTDPTVAPGSGASSGAETRQRVSELLAQDRASAIAWLEAEMAPAAAQQRLRMLTDVASLLTRDDEAFLRRLQEKDRSTKVVALALQLLRRHGCAPQPPDDLGALDYIERRKRAASPGAGAIGTPAKINSTRATLLAKLLEQLSFAELADHLGMTAPDLIKAWDWENAHPGVTYALQRCVFETGGDAERLALFQLYASRLDQLAQFDAAHIEHLGPALKSAAVSALIDGLGAAQHACREVLDVLARWRLETLSRAQSAELWERARTHPDLDPALLDKDVRFEDLASPLFELAMRLQPAEAQAALDLFTEKGLHSADPLLTPLHLNVSLPDISQEGP